MEQESGDCIGYGSTLSAKNPVTADPDAVDVQVGGELTGIAHVNLQENDRLLRGDIIILALFLLAVSILGVITPAGLVGDYAQFAFCSHFINKALGLAIERNLLDAQFRCAPDARNERTHDNGGDKKAAIFTPSGRSITLTRVV